MDRVYRVAEGGRPSYVVERDGRFMRAVLEGAHIFHGYRPGDPLPKGLRGQKILAPVEPSKMVCVGLNYHDHAAEMRKPLPPEPLAPATTLLP